MYFFVYVYAKIANFTGIGPESMFDREMSSLEPKKLKRKFTEIAKLSLDSNIKFQ
jgi:hypothetical protein